jgi:hypothetical protein
MHNQCRPRFPRIRLDHNRPIGPFDANTPAAGCVTRWEWFDWQLVDMPAARRQGAYLGLDLLDGTDVDDRLLAVAADSEHAGIVTRWEVRIKGEENRPDKPRPDASIIVGVNP